ncbi:phosphomannomutase/phosphoglucomutase [Microbulbifer sp. 2205BS26-8]|uniref:phosphomannomutase/phosphoglucomutase n=1 Tax=Microbulbifer sp. 2205BS26-8 TaxID=3064386 RepID=UPI00273D6732|nr:phosphomannomutase/phosphoglucomutase [Microbulbifer sp. 2205BS26-8]MDP5210474.1 phosphomannomutase/phosphoglucomutase [Microbulbifer sp. 2205BS26-8]
MVSNNKDHRRVRLHKGLLLPSLLAAATWLGGAYLLMEYVVDPYNQNQVRQEAQQQGETFAQIVQQQLSERSRRLQAVRAAEIPAFTQLKTAQLLEGSSVQVFTEQQIQVGAGANPTLNFALVDLLKRGQTESLPPLEILRTGKDNSWQLHNVLNLQGAQLLISQPFAILENALNKLDRSQGQIQLIQKFPDAPAQILWRGGQGAGHATRVNLQDSYLRVQFSPSDSFTHRHSLPALWIYLGAGAGTLISLVLLVAFLPKGTKAPWERRDNGTKGGTGTSVPAEDVLQEESAMPQGLASAPSIVADVSRQDGENNTAGKQPAVAMDRSGLNPGINCPQHVFRAYDIRGIAGEEINEPFAYQLGRALGTLAQHAGESILLVGRDGRNSSELLGNCLMEGILDSGCNSINLGLIPSPLLYYACAKGKNTNSGVIVTASHNPAEDNGFKIVLKGRPLAEEKLQGLYQLMQKGPFKQGEGSNRAQEIKDKYIDEILNNVALAGQPHLVVDAGNGAASVLAPRLFEQLGCAVTPIFCEVDGNFPNHPPDPSQPENLQALIDKVAECGADLGVALDGDGDRVTLVSRSGRIAWADQLVMLLARDILGRHPGEPIVFDVKSSRSLAQLVSQYGGRPVMWKTGHAPIKTKMLETKAILGGELSGHIFIRDRWFGFDDGMYAAARILEIMALREQTLDELLDSLPRMESTPEILLPVEEREKFSLVDQLRERGDFAKADINTIDGLRIEFPDGWGLVRASNTTSALTLRFEAENAQALERIRTEVMDQLRRIAPAITVPNWQLVD